MTPNPWRTTTDTDSMGRVRVRKPAIERFFTYVREDDGSDCWIWTGAHHPLGYGHFKFQGKVEPAHRWAYEVSVTPRVNMVRGHSPAAFTYATDVCRRGHPMADAYLFSGRRACRTCHLAAQHRYQSRRKAAA